MLAWWIMLYLVGSLAVGAWAARRVRTTEDYVLAGRSLSAPLVGVTLFATWYGPEFIMGVPGYFVAEGVMGTITDQFGTLLCLLLVAGLFARRLYRLGIVTLSDYFRLRYGPRVELATSLIQVISYFPWIAAQFVALGYLFELVVGIPVGQGIMLGAGIVVAYTYVGGMWAVTLTDLLQSVVIVAGLAWVALSLGSALPQGWVALLDAQPAGFYDLLPAPNVSAWSDYLAMWMAFGLGAIPSQEIYQRLFAARSGRAGQAGVLLAGLLLFAIGAVPSVIGLGAATLYPELLDNAQGLVPMAVLQHTGLPAQVLFFGALISAVLSTSSGAMLAPATVIGENLVRPRLPHLTDGQLLRWTRWSVVLVALIAGVFAFNDRHIHGLVVDSAVLLLVCLLAPLTVGLYWKGATRTGAWAAMVVGAGTWLLARQLISPIDPTIWGTAASFLAMFVGSHWPHRRAVT